MPKSEREASLLEAKLLSALHHPNIVTCYESFTERGRLCIVMDYCAGGDLYQRLKRQKGVLLAEDRVLDWFTQMCLGLKHVHDRKVLHRDLKTQNVFMTADGRCKLGDFGVSKVLSGTTQLAQTAVGTPYYLSPEICENKAYDNKSDIWSLGCVLYELCTLQHPFEGASLKLLIVKILRGNYAPVSSRYSRAIRDVIAQMLQRDPARRPSVNEILSRQPFKDMAKRWLDDDVHADEFSHTVIHRKPGSRIAKRVTDPNSKIAGGGVRLSPPRSRPAPYPSGGEGVPTRPDPPTRPLPSRGGGLIAPSREGQGRVMTSDARKPSDNKVAFTPPVHRVAAARGGGVPIWAAHAANMARPYEPVPLPSRQNPPTHPNFGRAQSAAAEAARARREAEEINRRRREQALEERRRKLREEEEARMARRKKADEARAREREEAEKRRAAEREEARREFLRRQAEARANKQRAQADLGNQPVEVEVLVPKQRAVESVRPSPPRHSAPAAVAAPAGPLATPAATKKRPSPPPSAAPSRRPAERETSSAAASQSSSPPPSQSSSPPRKKPSPDRPAWEAETKTGPKPDEESRNPVGGRVAGFVKVGQVTRECSGIDARRRVWEENKAAAERNRARAEGIPTPARRLGGEENKGGEGNKAENKDDVPALPPPRSSAVSRTSSPSARCEPPAAKEPDPRRKVWEENKAAAERNRERAMTDAVTAVEGVDGASSGNMLGVEVHADANGARVFVDAPTNCVLGATTCEPTTLASRLGALGAPEEGRGGGSPEVDPMAIRAGSALRSGEDDGDDDDGDDDAGDDVDMTEVDTATAYAAPDRDGDAASSDATSAGRRSKSSKSSKSSEDGGLDSTSSLDHDSTFVAPAKFYLDGRTVMLRDVDERSTLPDRVEALRVHLERALGETKFVRAYRALDNLSESDDEDKVVSSLCDVMGEDISYLGLIHQLLVCEDSMHAANEGVEE